MIKLIFVCFLDMFDQIQVPLHHRRTQFLCLAYRVHLGIKLILVSTNYNKKAVFNVFKSIQIYILVL